MVPTWSSLKGGLRVNRLNFEDEKKKNEGRKIQKKRVGTKAEKGRGKFTFSFFGKALLQKLAWYQVSPSASSGQTESASRDFCPLQWTVPRRLGRFTEKKLALQQHSTKALTAFLPIGNLISNISRNLDLKKTVF